MIKNIGLRFMLDTNRINAREDLPYMNQLAQWASDGLILISLSKAAMKEAEHGGNLRRKKKTRTYVYEALDETIDNPDEADDIAFDEDLDATRDTQGLKAKIEKILCPDGEINDNIRNDIRIVYSALNHKCILITNDGASKRQPNGILGNKDKLAAIGLIVMRDEDAVALVERMINER